MFTRISSLLAALVVFAFGLTAFVPSAWGCGTGTGGASCREVAPAAFVTVQQLVMLIDGLAALLP